MNPKEKRKKNYVRRSKPREPEHEPPLVVESNAVERNGAEDADREECERVPGDDCEAIVDDSDDELVEQVEENEAREDEASIDEVLVLGKTFSSAAEFKQALLRYSLKTKYDFKLYISSQLKLGAVCSDTEYDCPWRVYCSYEKRKHKLQIKVYVNERTCIRSGY